MSSSEESTNYHPNLRIFSNMLNRIEPRHQVQAAKLLRICHQRGVDREAERQNEFKDGSYDPFENKQISGSIYTLGLALVDEYDLNMRRVPDLHPLSLEEKQMKCQVLEARLRSRCCGLLEVHGVSGLNERCFCGYRRAPYRYNRSEHFPTIDGLIDSKVVFMHRTVFEFLSNPELWEFDCLQIPGDNYDAHGVLCRMNLYLAYVTATNRSEDSKQINELTTEALLCAKLADETFGEATASMLYTFSQMTFDLINILCERKDFANEYPFFARIKKHVQPSEKPVTQLTLILAVESGMVNMPEHMGRLGILSPAQETSLLWHAIDRPYSKLLPSYGLDISPNMIAFLFSKGFDPNMTFTSLSPAQITPWKSWLLYMHASIKLGKAPIAAEITELFLKAGADVDVQIPETGQSIEVLIKRRLTGLAPNVSDLSFALTRDERALRTRCDDILQLIASERMRRKARMK